MQAFREGVEGSNGKRKGLAYRVPKEFLRAPTSSLCRPSVPLPGKALFQAPVGWRGGGIRGKAEKCSALGPSLSAHQHRVPGYTSIGSLCPCGCCFWEIFAA